LKLCMFITGTTGSGKTTLVRALGARGFRTVHTGEMFRAEHGTIKEGESAIAPQSYDAKVKGYILDTIKSITGPVGLVAIECFPRSVEQVEWLTDMKEVLGWDVVVVVLDADCEIRYNRVASRDAFSPDRMKHDRNKMVEEGDMFQQELTNTLVYGAKYNKLLVIPCDTSKWDYSIVQDTAQSCDIRILINCAMNYWYKKTMSNAGQMRTAPNPASMVEKAMFELEEWNVDARPEELIDALWFVFMAMVGCGWSAETIFNQFMFKYRINEERMEKGIKPHETILEGGE